MEHSQFREKSQPMNDRFWQCNLQENGVNLGHIMTGSANNNQTVNGISPRKDAESSCRFQRNYHAVPVDETFQWKQYHQTPDLYALRGDDVSIGYDVKKDYHTLSAHMQ
ncbi:hypothetical protein HanRHA438_Chr13g0626451 [Helianthus annuus]|nr:hypothetical protein HanRHA438_Chr13g0626451 [Helianthus annuus]